MTIVVGVVEDGHVYLGADSRGSWGSLARPLTESKVWTQAGMVLGLTGRCREAQIIQHLTVLPSVPEDASRLVPWLCSDFIDAIRATRKTAGYDERMEGQSLCEYGPGLILGVRGRLFVVHGDYSVAEYPNGAAMGSGEAAARGSLHTSAALGVGAEQRVTLALEAACTHDIYCAPPFTCVSTKA